MFLTLPLFLESKIYLQRKTSKQSEILNEVSRDPAALLIIGKVISIGEVFDNSVKSKAASSSSGERTKAWSFFADLGWGRQGEWRERFL